jgi:hypothetical protein
MNALSDELESERQRHVVECQNTELPPHIREQYDIWRRQVAYLELVGIPLPLVLPSAAYQALFLAALDATILRAIQTVLGDAQRRAARWRQTGQPFDQQGYEYAFWISTDPPDIIKIGRTAQQPYVRIAEWQHELAPGGPQVVLLLWDFPTRYEVLAESLLHTVLECEHLGKRRNARNGRRLVEFFQIDNVLALRIFMALVTRYADALGDSLVK